VTAIFLTHTPHMLANYYGERALAELRQHGEVRLNETGRVLDDPLALAEAAGDARIVVADRQTPAPATSSTRCRDWRRSAAWRWTSATSTWTRRAGTACW
jgi:hypothetical protein